MLSTCVQYFVRAAGGTDAAGRNRRRIERITMAAALPMAALLVGTGVAIAAPAEQGGVGVEEAPFDQPGVPADPQAAPESEPVTAAPESGRADTKEYWVAPPTEYDNVPTRPAAVVYYDEYVDEPIAPVTVQELHLPIPVEPVAPIEAPARRLRLGDYVADRPNWLSEANLDKTNNTAAVAEAQVNTFWRSIGVETSRADRIGAATIGGAAVGGLGGATAVGLPAALLGGLLGGGVGVANAAPAALIGAAATAGLGAVPAATLNTAAGAAIGAAALGIPVAVAAGTTGAVLGAATGMTLGAGDTLAEPIEVQIPDAPTADRASITETTRNTVAQADALPGGPVAVDAIRDVATHAPVQAADATAQIRATAVAQPGGADLVQRVEAVGTAIAPVTGPVGEAFDAVRAGLV